MAHKDDTVKQSESRFYLIIAGSRDYDDYQRMAYVTDRMLKGIADAGMPVTIISGGARGADTLAERYAKERGFELNVMPADWDNLGKRAGYIRNRAMSDYVSQFSQKGMLCFWDGQSKGTRDNFSLAGDRGIPLKVLDYKENKLLKSSEIPGYLEAKTNAEARNGRLKAADISLTNQANGNLGDRGLLSMLAPYFSKADNRTLSRQISDDMLFYPGMAEGAKHICRHLHDNGLHYSLLSSGEKGKLTVQLEVTRERIQILCGHINVVPGMEEKDVNKAWSRAKYDSFNQGRVMDGGIVYRYDVSLSTGGEPKMPSPKERAKLLDFSLSRPGVKADKASFAKSLQRYHFMIGKTPAIVETEDFGGLSFSSSQAAEEYLKKAINEAKTGYLTDLDLDEMVQCIKNNETFVFSDDEDMAVMQDGIWTVLMRAHALDEQNKLPLVDVHNPEDSIYALDEENSLGFGLNPEIPVDTEHGFEAFAHSFGEAFVNSNVSSFEHGFDPAMVAKSMNNDGHVLSSGELLIQAMKACHYDMALLKDATGHAGYYTRILKDKSIAFDSETGVGLSEISQPFARRCIESVRDTLVSGGLYVEEKDIQMDANGIIAWKAVRPETDSKKSHVVSGQVGQIFLPDDRGTVTTAFGGSDNYEFIPGYRAYLVPSKTPDVDVDDFRERHRVVGYEQIIEQALRHQVRKDMLSNKYAVDAGPIDSVTELNKVYSRVYGTRFVPGELDRMVQQGDIRQDFADAIRKTLASRVRYDNKYLESTTNAASNAEFYEKGDKDGEDSFSVFEQTGRRNLRVLDRSMDGIFDPDATVAGINQGIVRYLAEGAKVNPDGTLTGGDEEHCALLNLPEFTNARYNQHDRVVMAVQQAITAKRIDNGVGTAMMGFGGWNMEDGYVISQDFADRNAILDSKGIRRSLRRGDKVSDFNGNKGVVGLIVDRHKTAEEQTVCPELPFPAEAVQFFKDNPEVDVVLSPYSPISRANGGAYRDLQSDVGTLHVFGKDIEGARGLTNFIITDKTVDEKTHLYDGADAKTIGRKISGQLAWALDSADCTKILDSVYGGNVHAVENYREYLMAVGYDMAPDGTILDEYTPHKGEKRHVFSIKTGEPSQNPIMRAKARDNPVYAKGYRFEDGYEYLLYKSHGQKISQDLVAVKARDKGGPKEAFLDAITDRGGFLEVPWPLQYYTEPGCGEKRLQEVVKADGTKSYLLPVMAPELRSGQVEQDGETMRHNFTATYGTLYERVYDYKRHQDMIARREMVIPGLTLSVDERMDGHPGLKAELDVLLSEMNSYRLQRKKADKFKEIKELLQREAPELSDDWLRLSRYKEDVAKARYGAAECERSAYDMFSGLSRKIAQYYINGQNGKHSYLRDNIMGRRMAGTATLVCVPDPRLPLDTVSMNRRTMESLGINQDMDKESLVWRDPILKDGGVRYFKVMEDPSVDGIGTNPAVAKSFSQDYDGDADGAFGLKDEDCRKEAREKLSPWAHMLDTGVKKKGIHPLNFGLDQDIRMAAYESKGEPLVDNLDRETYLANLELALNQRKGDAEFSKFAFRQLNAYVHNAFQRSYGSMPLRFDSIEHLHEDLDHMIASGAKGSAGKRDNLYYWMGVDYDAGSGVLNDHGREAPDVRERRMKVQEATAMKADTTGEAGGFSQQTVQALRNHDVKMAIELIEGVTQGVLSIKGNADHAKVINRNLKVRMPNLLRFGVAADTEPGKRKHAARLKKQEFARQLEDVLTNDKTGFGVKTNPDYIRKLSDILADRKGVIRPLSEMRAHPMDYLAYNDGSRDNEGLPVQPLAKMERLAAEKANLFGPAVLPDGRKNYNYHFSPMPVRNVTENTCIMKESCREKNLSMQVMEQFTVNPDYEAAQSYAKERQEEVLDVPDLCCASDNQRDKEMMAG